MLQGFQPQASVATAFWRFQNKDSGGNVTTEWYVNFGDVKWFKTFRAPVPPVGGQEDKVAFWFNPKEQDNDPDLVLTGPSATEMLADLDAIWAASGSPPAPPPAGFQPNSSIDAAFWRFQYTNPQGAIVSEIYLNFGVSRWLKTVRAPVPPLGARSDQVSLWFNNRDQDFNPDLVLDGPAAAKLLADLDALWA